MEEHHDLFRSCEKTEIRIDNETVEDVAYELDLNIGEYVGISRIARTNVSPAEPLNLTTEIQLAISELAEAQESDKQRYNLTLTFREKK